MKFYRFHDLELRGVPWTRKHLYELERTGRFPKRVKLGANTVAWSADEVDRFVADKLKARETETTA